MSQKIISIGQLQKGDVVLSTTSDPVSKIVKFATDSKYSHARIFIGNGNIVEAIDPKVVTGKLIDVMKGDLYTAVYRYPGLTEMKKLKIIHYANQQLDKEYDLSGAIGSSRVGMMASPALTITNLIDSESDFYCSELVAFSYKHAGVRLGFFSSSTTPKDLAKNKKLEYIGHLKTGQK